MQSNRLSCSNLPSPRVFSWILLLVFLLSTVPLWAQSPVARHGRLSVSGSQIRDQHGAAVQLRGVSLFWSQWEDGSAFYNADVVNYLADNWNISVIRCAMAADQGGWISNAGEADKVRTVVNAAIAKGIYVIIDWHTHNTLTSDAKRFFSAMAQEFGSHPNIIYEIYNEPLDIPWGTVKSYASEVVSSIRAHDRQNLIIIGTPNWSQDVDVASRDKVSGTNLAYALHFYAGTHEAWLRTKAQNAIGAGAALFVTEWGTTHADGGTQDRQVYTAASDTWLNWLDNRNISWVNWSVTTKDEASAILRSGASNRGGWSDANLTESGRYVRNRLRGYPSVRGPASSSSAGTSSGSTGGNGGLDAYGEWGVYVDELGSSIQPAMGETPLSGEGSAQKARLEMNILAEPEWEEDVELQYPFLGMLVEFPGNGVLGSSNSITLTYKSAGDVRMGFMQTGISEPGSGKEGQEWGFHLIPSATANTVTIPFNTLEQPSWIEEMTSFTKGQVYGIKWELKANTAGPSSGFIEILSIGFDGYTSLRPTSSGYTKMGLVRLQGRSLWLGGAVGNADLQLLNARGREVWSQRVEAGQRQIFLPAGAGYGWRNLVVRNTAGVQVQPLMIME